MHTNHSFPPHSALLAKVQSQRVRKKPVRFPYPLADVQSGGDSVYQKAHKYTCLARHALCTGNQRMICMPTSSPGLYRISWDLVVLELQLKTKQDTFNHLACIGSLGLPVQTNVLAGKEESWRPVFLLIILEMNYITCFLKWFLEI